MDFMQETFRRSCRTRTAVLNLRKRVQSDRRVLCVLIFEGKSGDGAGQRICVIVLCGKLFHADAVLTKSCSFAALRLCHLTSTCSQTQTHTLCANWNAATYRCGLELALRFQSTVPSCSLVQHRCPVDATSSLEVNSWSKQSILHN